MNIYPENLIPISEPEKNSILEEMRPYVKNLYFNIKNGFCRVDHRMKSSKIKYDFGYFKAQRRMQYP